MTSLPIPLHDGYTPSVSVGDSVNVGQVLATKTVSPETAVINISRELHLTPEKVGKALRKNPGDTIEPGDVIASRKGLFGMGEQKVVSSITGTVSGFERRTGELVLHIGGKTDSEKKEIFSPVDGTIKVCDNEKIVIATEKDSFVPEKGIGGTIQAEILVLNHDADNPVPLHLLTSEIIGKVIVARIIDRDGLLKAVGMDTGGIIVTQLPDEDAAYLLEKKLSLPLVQVVSTDYEKLRKHEGKRVFVDGEKKNIVLLHG
jgi:hypothetical protein